MTEHDLILAEGPPDLPKTMLCTNCRNAVRLNPDLCVCWLDLDKWSGGEPMDPEETLDWASCNLRWAQHESCGGWEAE